MAHHVCLSRWLPYRILLTSPLRYYINDAIVYLHLQLSE